MRPASSHAYTALSRRRARAVGNLDNFHSAFALHPGSGYAVIVLLSGAYPDAGALAYDAFDVFQPAVDAALAAAVGARYAGRWRSADGRSEAALRVVRGTLWLDRYVLQGADVLRVFGVPNAPPGRGAPIPLREVREDEFRCAAPSCARRRRHDSRGLMRRVTQDRRRHARLDREAAHGLLRAVGEPRLGHEK